MRGRPGGRTGGRVFVLNAGGAAVTLLYLGSVLQQSIPAILANFTVYAILSFAVGALIPLAIPHFTKLAWQRREADDATAAEHYVRRARALAVLSALMFAAGVGLVSYAVLNLFA